MSRPVADELSPHGLNIALPASSEQNLAGEDWQDAVRYLPMFIDEARQTHDEIIDALLALEAGGGSQEVRKLAIALHRLKGSAASIGLHRLAELTHEAEDRLQALGNNPQPYDTAFSEVLFAFADGLQQQVEALRSGRFGEDTFAAVKEALRQASASPTKHRSEPNPAESSALLQPAEKPSPADRKGLIEGQVTFQPGLSHAALKACLLHERLSALGQVEYFQPPPEQLEETAEVRTVSFGLRTEKQVERVRQALQIVGVEQVALKPATDALAPLQYAKPAETIRVELERLERLLNLAGQLTLCKMRFLQLGERFGKVAAEAGQSWKTLLTELHEATASLGRLTDAVRRCAMEMRMTPIGPLLARFNRVVRDIRRRSGKDVRLITSGEKTELDKRLIDELAEPLIHLVRNAADHGIESPQERSACGKPPYGTITLEVCRRGHNVIIHLADDGRGIDMEKLRSKALQRGLLPPAEIQRMSEEQLTQLVWLPGLSTRDEASEVSGRGMGMDLVRARIERLGGTIELHSRTGQGTSVILKLPVTLVVLPCLHVEIGGARYALPLDTVEEAVSFGPESVKTLGRRLLVAVRGRLVPLLKLADFYNPLQAPRTKYDQHSFLAVILGHAERRLALKVDRLLGVRETLVKSLAANYRNVPGVAGASIDGNGRILLILDPAALFDQALEMSLL